MLTVQTCQFAEGRCSEMLREAELYVNESNQGDLTTQSDSRWSLRHVQLHL